MPNRFQKAMINITAITQKISLILSRALDFPEGRIPIVTSEATSWAARLFPIFKVKFVTFTSIISNEE